ncbi:MAG TPA: amino acid permease [Opitutaceae bacterium]|jgi:APA family basic amino acid/polyamine antiporter|nr:amino acid permease [Opitutaceae bacterium]
MKNLFIRKSLAQLHREIEGDNRLRRALGPVQLTSLGIGCVIGAGIFVVTGQAAHDKAGPAIMLSFVVAGLVCVFSALCYAEFASMVPVAGSAYTYAYATLGELAAWIIGWDLLLEYTIASSAVAHGWSQYFQEFIGTFLPRIPAVIAKTPFDYDPGLGRFVATGSVIDLPAILVTVVLTAILVRGIRESASFNTVMVIIKLAVVVMVIGVGAFYVNPANWHPFAPFGYSGLSLFGKTLLGQTGAGGEPLGMLAGSAIIFFAYIGFDAVSTQAEEAKNPSRDIPIGILASLAVCTVLYLAVAAVLTGMVPYRQINIDAPVADAFRRVGLPWAHLVISIGAVVGITSVLLVLMLSQPRVMLAMARDGLVSARFFGAVHPRFRTPWLSQILMGCCVSALAGFLPLRILAELVNIGTLLAFFVVCAAVLVLRRTHPNARREFRAPWVPVVPLLGMASSLLLMFSLPRENWWRLFIWLLVGFVIYFSYGRRHSALRLAVQSPVLPGEERSG